MMTSDMQMAFLRLIDEIRALVKKVESVPPPKVFRVGQLVRRTARTNGGPPIGCIGVVRCLSYTSGSPGVEWAVLTGWNGVPHALETKLRSNCGWYVPPTDLELCNLGEA